jgi:hypothetical protein
MNRTLFNIGLLTTMFSCSSLYSQDSLAIVKKIKFDRFFVGAGVITNFDNLGRSLNGTLLLSNNFGLGFNTKSIRDKSKNKPANYYPGSNVLGSDPKSPSDQTGFYSLMFIKEININKNKVRIGFEAGPSYNQFQFYTFKSIEPSQGFFGYTGNYSVKPETKSIIGLSAKGKIYYLFTQHYAFELSAFTNVNSHQNFAGLEINALFGIIEKKNN